MSATNVIDAQTTGRTGRAGNVALWVLQLAAAAMLAMAGFAKLSSDPGMVGLYDAIGIGQWFRYLTGILEVSGALLLVVPRFAGLGALIAAPVMLGAVLAHLFVVGGSPVVPLVLLVVLAVVAYARWERMSRLVGG